MSGWIKLHRSLKDWEWYGDHNATRMLIHLLVSVNYEDKKWRGEQVKAGSIVLSYESLSREVGLSVQQCRTALSKLECSNQITRKVTSKYQVVSLCKWDKLQCDIESSTSKQQATEQPSNNQSTTTKEYKEIKEDNKSPKVDFDFDKFLTFINTTLGKNHTVINQAVRKSIKARLREGYTKESFVNAVLNLKEVQTHRENNYTYCTPEFISRSATLDKYGQMHKVTPEDRLSQLKKERGWE